MTHPVFGLDLDVRINGRKGVGDSLRRQYAWMLQSNTLIQKCNIGETFAIEEGSRSLFTTAVVRGHDGVGNAGGMKEICVTPLSTNGNDGPTLTYDFTNMVPILNSFDSPIIVPLNERLLIWASHGSNGFPGEESSALSLSKKYADDSVPWQNRREEFGEWGTTVLQISRRIWDLAAPPSDISGAEAKHLVISTSAGVRACDFEYGTRGMTDFKFLPGSKGEFRTVHFKDQNVFMAGDRRGDIIFGDLRTNSSVLRLSNPSAVTGLRKMRNDNLILVNGLSKMGIYDLRYTEHKQESRRFSDMLLDFNVPESMRQQGYGMGFDYDEELNLAASASTDFLSRHKVGLWDCGTGKMITESALVEQNFAQPVRCLQIVDLRGHGPSAKSIVTASGGVIEEWHV